MINVQGTVQADIINLSRATHVKRANFTKITKRVPHRPTMGMHCVVARRFAPRQKYLSFAARNCREDKEIKPPNCTRARNGGPSFRSRRSRRALSH